MDATPAEIDAALLEWEKTGDAARKPWQPVLSAQEVAHMLRHPIQGSDHAPESWDYVLRRDALLAAGRRRAART